MRVLYYLSCTTILFSSYATTTQAHIDSSLSTALIEYTTKTKPTVKPKSQDFNPLTSLSVTLVPRIKSGDDNYFLRHPELVSGSLEIEHSLRSEQVALRSRSVQYSWNQIPLILDHRIKSGDDITSFLSLRAERFIDNSRPIKLAGVRFITDTGSNVTNGVTRSSLNCPSGSVFDPTSGHCQKFCDRTQYPFSSTPSSEKGSVGTCKDKNGTFYGYLGCNDGWELSGADCVIPEGIEGYPYGSIDSIVGKGECKKFGAENKCKYTSCNEGWDFNNGRCNVHTCNSSDYPYTSNPGNEAGVQKTACKTGTTYRYGYQSCYEGWDKTNGYCNVHSCDSYTYPYSYSPSSYYGSTVSCKTGTNYRYAYDSCISGYHVSDGYCEADCDYTNDSYPENCSYVDSCERDGTTYYYCYNCDTGYSPYYGTCEENDCSDYPTDTAENCTRKASCIDTSGIHYKCTKCDDLYVVENGVCIYDEEAEWCNANCAATDSACIGNAGWNPTITCPDGRKKEYCEHKVPSLSCTDEDDERCKECKRNNKFVCGINPYYTCYDPSWAAW